MSRALSVYAFVCFCAFSGNVLSVNVQPMYCSANTIATLKNCVKNIGAYAGLSISSNLTCYTANDCCGPNNSPLIDLSNHANKTVKGNIAGSPHRFIKRSAGQKTCPLIRAGNGTIVKDLTIDEDAAVPACNPSDNCANTVLVHARNNVTLDNVHIYNSKGNTVQVWGSDYFTFKNGQITSAGIIGLYIGHKLYAPSNRFNISNSTFRYARTNAIAIESAAGTHWNDNWISSNQIYQNHKHGLWMCGNVVCPGGQLYIAYADGLAIYNNNIWGGSCANCGGSSNGGISGIELGPEVNGGATALNNVTISTNQIHDNTGVGMWLNVGTTIPNVGFASNSIYSNAAGCVGPLAHPHPPCQ